MTATNFEYENYVKDCNNQGITEIFTESEWEKIQKENQDEFYSCAELVNPSEPEI